MWDASESEGNLPIVNYYIQWMNKTEDTWREATVEASGELAYTITGLKTFTEYSVRVFASNGKYNGTAAEMDLTSGEDSEWHTYTRTHTRTHTTHACMYVNTHYLSEAKREQEREVASNGPMSVPDKQYLTSAFVFSSSPHSAGESS